MNIEFDEQSHCYAVNGDIVGISVTELLAKHGLAPNYDGVKSEYLKASAEKGKAVHKDLEYVLNKKDYEPTTEQGRQFTKWVQENLDCGVGEQMLAYDYKGMTIAGTADVMGILKNGELLVGDHKNTSAFHREYVTWQVSLLDYMARQLGDNRVNGKWLNWKGASRFYCFHYNKDSGELKVYDLEKIPDSEIEKLLECEFNNEKYQRPQLVINKDLEEAVVRAEEYLASVQRMEEEATQKAKELREQLLNLFKEQNIKSWESPNKKVQVTYVAPVERMSVDSKKLKEEYPEVFTRCQKLTRTKASLRIKTREDEDEEF